MDGEQQEEIVDRCLERLLQGESLEHILLSYPDQRAELAAALGAAQTLLHATVPEPSPRARSTAMNAMLRQVRTEAARPALPGIFAWFGTLRARPLAFQGLAVVAAVMVFGGLGIGASAATGTAPSPVRTFFGINSDSHASVRLSGPIVSVDHGMLVLRTTSGERSITLTSSTAIHRSTNRIDLSALLVGEPVDVTATDRDGTVTAREIRTADDDTPVANAPAPADTPQPSDSGEQHDAGASPTTEGDDAHGDRTSTPSGTITPKGDDHGATRTPDHEDASKTAAARTPARTPTQTPEAEGDHGDR